MLFIYRGLPGSGKTTSALNLQRHLMSQGQNQSIIIERDRIRKSLFGSIRAGDPSDEKKVTDVQLEQIKRSFELGLYVISSDTNLVDRKVRQLIGLAHKVGVPVTFMDLRNVDVDVCVERDQLRKRSVGEDVIRAKHERYIRGRKLVDLPYEEFKSANGRVPDFSGVLPYSPPTNPLAKSVVLVDMDGTLCNHNGRDPYDDSLYHEDLVYQNVKDTVLALYIAGYQIDIMTGRYEKFRDVCTQWLMDNQIPFTNLHMRHMDGRDDLVKQLMFEKHYRNNPYLNIKFAIDDRDRVVDMYRKVLDIQVFQVNYGDF